MKTFTYLFEFYENTADEWHAEYEDFDAPTLGEAMTQFSKHYPFGRIINHYVQVNGEGKPT
jgi:hypothetical protein